MSTANRKYKDSCLIRYVRVPYQTMSFSFRKTHFCREPPPSVAVIQYEYFCKQAERCKELGKKVPQAYRIYVEDTFLPCDAADARIFAKENFLSLYNALHGTNLQLSCPVENIRLDNVMYMNIVNDVSCLVDNKIIVLTEHPRSRMYIRVHS